MILTEQVNGRVNGGSVGFSPDYSRTGVTPSSEAFSSPL